ncbi:glycosyltransferase [Sinomicrobium weinanense]|uniref:Glycosyltransferase n=1 Tax=Sinomicrobium weinanense TaxID=2842200 RepID=A0A926Q5M2_9FLAO|nr:glycosyltransferase [Sinomicrobium weinanense]MBC9798130.1 glycosyltransferase [Sinomicrobium weinanense]MBU3123709.1 glycosyltransferase [Sinomicrobium weinanense]
MKKLIVGITAPNSISLLKGQIKYFIVRGYNVFLLAPKTEKTIQFCLEEGCTLLPVDIKREISLWSDFKALYVIILHFIRVKPDIINVGTPKISLLGMLAGKLCNVKKRIYTCRGFRYESESGKTKRLLMFFERIIAKYSHRIICISKSIEVLGKEHGIFRENKTIVIGNGSSNGLDLSLFMPEKITENLKTEYKTRYAINGFFTFGFVGRFNDRKGVNELYEAFQGLYGERTDVRLMMVGGIEATQVSDKELIDKYNSHPGIIMVGRKPFEQMPIYMSLFDCFVLPTWAEGFGNVFIQAAAMGIPIIGNDVTGCKDAVSDSYNGVLIKEIKNSEVLKNKMLSLMDNVEMLRIYGENGKIWAKGFDQNVIWEGIKKIYEE